MTQTVPAALAACEVTDEDGKNVRLESLWRDKPVVLVWVRHFG
jgi:hypothetical protein